MSESGDYDPGPWRGHDFASARKKFDTHAGRSYDDAKTSGKTVHDLIPKSIKTDSIAPLVIVTDQTGSMGEWPAVMFSKLPYLDKEGQEYLGDDMEIAFMAIGDANSGKGDGQPVESYPLQVRQFAKGLELEKRLKELVIEGKGGGQTSETYELAALYCLEKVEIPKAVKPLLIFIGDEQPYEYIDPDNAERLVGVKLEKSMPTLALFKKLREKFSVYLIRKPYGRMSDDNDSNAEDKQIFKAWARLVGEDHICNLPEAQRVVDVIFGIMARETGRIAYFEHELEDRQDADQVKTVYKSLRTVHAIPDAARGSVHTGKSVIRKSKSGTGKDVKPLV